MKAWRNLLLFSTLLFLAACQPQPESSNEQPEVEPLMQPLPPEPPDEPPNPRTPTASPGTLRGSINLLRCVPIITTLRVTISSPTITQYAYISRDEITGALIYERRGLSPGTYTITPSFGPRHCPGGSWSPSTRSVTLTSSTPILDADFTYSVPLPIAPRIWDVETGKDYVSLTWRDESTNETSFEVDRKTQTGTWQLVLRSYRDFPAGTFGTGELLSLVNSPLTPATYYCYRVRAINNALAQSISEQACEFTKSLEPPRAPTNLRVTATAEHSITLAWDDNANNETGFRVKAMYVSGVQEIRTPNLEIYTFAGLSSGRRYCFTVRAFNSDGESAPSNEACGTTNPSPQQGYTQVAVINCHNDKRTVYLYTQDITAGGKWVSRGSLSAQWSADGSCPYPNASPLLIPLVDGHLFLFVAVDPYLIDCEGRNDPDYGPCLKFLPVQIPGDADGPSYPVRIE